MSVQLPEGKLCTYCTIQWVWAARQDGGYYIGCSDISITADGSPPDFNAVPDQTGKPLSTLVVDGNGNVVRDATPGGSSAVGIAIGVTIAVVVVLIIGCVCYFRNKSGGGAKGSTPPPPGSDAGAAGLPPGWSAAVDPGSGRTYYVNASTGQTSWEPPAVPTSSTAAPQFVNIEMPKAAPGAPNLPAGWTAAVDPSSGQTYYMNSITGQTTWEPPVGRV